MERNIFLRALAWLGRHELALLLAVGALAAGVWLFAALADEVMEGGTQSSTAPCSWLSVTPAT